mmetsp:Transcript_12822/g.31452  ORF Transcript_12822/g.31452 Transcript_12822/m.31452 type:complete len:233 (-) Transcript_12822:858-1556(-)
MHVWHLHDKFTSLFFSVSRWFTFVTIRDRSDGGSTAAPHCPLYRHFHHSFCMSGILKSLFSSVTITSSSYISTNLSTSEGPGWASIAPSSMHVIAPTADAYTTAFAHISLSLKNSAMRSFTGMCPLGYILSSPRSTSSSCHASVARRTQCKKPAVKASPAPVESTTGTSKAGIRPPCCSNAYATPLPPSVMRTPRASGTMFRTSWGFSIADFLSIPKSHSTSSAVALRKPVP